MPTLLHLDSSFRSDDSVSRRIGATFAEHWRQANPDGEYRHRDLAADPLPHLDEAGFTAALTPPEQHTPEQRAGWAISAPLIAEVEAADVVLLGVPMYNFTIPSTLKAWLDRICVPKFRAAPDGSGPLAGKRFVVAAARGGAYGAGTPRERFEFQERYLRAVFELLGVGEVVFVNTEMTLADVNPALAQFKDLAAQSLADAHTTVRELATAGVPVGA